MNRLLACRVCLAYNTRLCSIMDGQFRDIYEKLVEASLDTEDMLPTTVCSDCYSMMKMFLRFVEKSRKANQILQQMIRSGLEPSVSSLDMLVKEQAGLSWTLGISEIDRTTIPSTSSEVKVKVELESVNLEMEIDGISDRNEDYSDVPVYEGFTSDYEDDLPLQNISKRCITDRVKVEETLQCNEHEDYSDDIPVHEGLTSDYEDGLPLQNISKRCITDRVKVEETLKVQLRNCNEHEGAEPPKKRKLDKNEAENELVNIQTLFIKIEKDDEPRENKEDKKKIPYYENAETTTSNVNSEHKNEAENELVNIQTLFIKIEKDEEPRENKEYKKKIPYYENAETTTSNVISEDQNQTALNKNDTVTPLKDIFTCDSCKNECQCKIHSESHINKSHVIESNLKDSINSDLNVINKCKSTNLLKVREIQPKVNRNENDRRENKFSDNTSQYECQYCMERFTCNYNLTNHMRVHIKGKPFICDICAKWFSKKANLTIHLRVHTKEKPYKCHICEKCFSASGHLTKHLRVHTKEKPFKCDICERGFSQGAHLTAHLRVHTKEKPFKCDLCDKRFSRRSNLTAHIKRHTKEKPFKCDISLCEKGFALRKDLIAHLRVHTQTKEKRFKCDICEKCFSESYHLTSHLKIHTKEKPFKCETCEKRFPEKSYLTKHFRVHTKEKPFKCGICGKGFSLSCNLNRHLRIHTK